MIKKITDIHCARDNKPRKATIEEIKKLAKKELEKCRDVVQEEPADLVSGDMEKIIRGDDDEDTTEK